MKCPTLDMLVQLATTYESVVGSPDHVRRPSQADGYNSDTDGDRIKYSPQNNYDTGIMFIPIETVNIGLSIITIGQMMVTEAKIHR
jgi:hypothetical protein